MQKPEQPPEGALLHRMRKAARPPFSIRGVAKAAGLSEGRWRQIENGYQIVRKGEYVEVTAPAETLARMAAALGAQPEQLDSVGRSDAADYMRETVASQAAAAPTKDSVEDDASFTVQLRDAVAVYIAVQKIEWALDFTAGVQYPNSVKDAVRDAVRLARDLALPGMADIAVGNDPRSTMTRFIEDVVRQEQERLDNDTDITQPRESSPSSVDSSAGGGEEGRTPPMNAGDKPADLTRSNQVSNVVRPQWGDRSVPPPSLDEADAADADPDAE